MSCGAVYHGWDNVRPLAGAGIEIHFETLPSFGSEVRPLAGAGIEMRLKSGKRIPAGGSPPRGGGN